MSEEESPLIPFMVYGDFLFSAKYCFTKKNIFNETNKLFLLIFVVHSEIGLIIAENPQKTFLEMF